MEHATAMPGCTARVPTRAQQCFRRRCPSSRQGGAGARSSAAAVAGASGPGAAAALRGMRLCSPRGLRPGQRGPTWPCSRPGRTRPGPGHGRGCELQCAARAPSRRPPQSARTSGGGEERSASPARRARQRSGTTSTVARAGRGRDVRTGARALARAKQRRAHSERQWPRPSRACGRGAIARQWQAALPGKGGTHLHGCAKDPFGKRVQRRPAAGRRRCKSSVVSLAPLPTNSASAAHAVRCQGAEEPCGTGRTVRLLGPHGRSSPVACGAAGRTTRVWRC